MTEEMKQGGAEEASALVPVAVPTVPAPKRTVLRVSVAGAEKPEMTVPRFVLSMGLAVYEQMFAYVDKSAVEISGLGSVSESRGDDGVWTIRINELYLLHQKNTASTTDLDMDKVQEFLAKRREEGKSLKDLKFWWHSHVNMDVFWSGTDNACVDAMENENYFVSIVVNKRRELRGRVDLYWPFRVTFDNLPIEVDVVEVSAPTEQEHYAAQVEEMCTTRRSMGYSGGGVLEYCYRCKMNHVQPVNAECRMSQGAWLRCDTCGYWHSERFSYCKKLLGLERNGHRDTRKDQTEPDLGYATLFELDYAEEFMKIHPKDAKEYVAEIAKNPHKPVHRVPPVSSMFTERTWYINPWGNMIRRKDDQLLKMRTAVTSKERSLYFGFDPLCTFGKGEKMCSWCLFNMDIVGPASSEQLYDQVDREESKDYGASI